MKLTPRSQIQRDDPLDLVFIVSTASVSGGEIAMLRIAKELQQLGHRVEVVTNRTGPIALSRHARALPIRAVALAPKLSRRSALKSVGLLPVTVWRVRRELTSAHRRGAVVVLQYKLEQIATWRHRHISSCVLLEHGPLPEPFRHGLVGALYRWVAEQCAELISVSHTAALSVESATGRVSAVIPNGADRPAAFTAPSLHSILFLGRIDRRKGIFELLGCIGKEDSLALVIAGVGPDLPAVSAIAGAINRERPGAVDIVGWTETPELLIAQSEWLALPTRDRGEGAPLAALEALQAGRRVIGTDDSPALLELRDRFGGEAVVLQPSSTWDEGRALQAARSTARPPSLQEEVPTWAVVAAQYATLIRAVADSQSHSEGRRLPWSS